VLREAIFRFFTGALIPLAIFPEWLKTISMFMPFQSMVHVPVSIYIGTLSGWQAVQAIGVQLIWLLAIVVFVRICWQIALRKVTIFG
jgi:ABC-2 type transport system permease protein